MAQTKVKACCLSFVSTENLLTEDIDLTEGDMKLTVDQKLELLARFRGHTSFKATKLWPGGVLIFDIDPSLGKSTPHHPYRNFNFNFNCC